MMENIVNNFEFKNYKLDQKIFLRQYQIMLTEIAKKQNTIIYLPTGGGKTMIAIHVLLSRSHEIIKPYNNGGKRAFFVANTKVLVNQLACTLKIHTKFTISFYTGDMNVDSWDMNKWQNEIKSNQVLVLTAEILRQILVLKFLEPTNISLIVFDECHHANQNHPYKQIMDFISNFEQSTRPLILGLSATLFKTNPKKNEIKKLLQALKSTYNGEIIGGQDWNEALKSSGIATEKIIHYDSVAPSLYMKNVSEIYKEAIDFCSNMFIKNAGPEIPEDGKDFKNRNAALRIKRHLDNANKSLEDLGAYCGSLAALYYTIVLEKYRIISNNKIEIQALLFAQTTFNKIRRLLSMLMGEEESYNMIYQFSSPKVQKMIDLTLDILQKNNNPSVLIFVHKKSTAIILAYLMKRLKIADARFEQVKAEFVIGSSIFSKVFYTPLKSNEEILKRFSTQEINFIFSTNVLEEGIDIPSCNFVISFDFPSGYASYIQSKGRARDQNSQYYIFCQTEKQISALETWKETLCTIKEVVGSENIFLDDTLEANSKIEESISIITKTKEEKIIDGITAIKCVERYCNFLPQDLFSFLTPVIWYKEHDKIKTAFLQLPISCPLRQTVSGEGKINLKLAKKSVFLKTVKLLHEKGLIDDNLCFLNYEEEEDLTYLFPHFENETINNFLPQPGTKKRRRIFNKVFADCISNCLPTPEKTIYLHVINFDPIFKEPVNVQKKILYDLIGEPCTYGILSTKKLPKICRFPLFLDLGKLHCNILENYETLILNANNIADIKLFHYALFKKVLNTVKNFHIFDNSNKENSFFIVPLQLNETQRYELNWNLIFNDFCKRDSPAVVPYNPNLNQENEINYQYHKSYENRTENQSISDSLIISNAPEIEFQIEGEKEKPSFIMNEEEYLNFVVCPIYRCTSPQQYYCVSLCCHNLSPISEFPRKEFKNYYDYYLKKYGKKITNLNQPLLKVTHLPNCSNFNNPLARSRKPKQIKDYQEYFVPELCDIIRFPPKYWIKAQFLPTVINRISFIYSCEELRKTITRDTGLGVLELPANSFWKPLVEVYDDNEKEEIKLCDFKFLNQKLPLSELKNKTDCNEIMTMDLERKIFEISSCDLENYVQGSMSGGEENYNFESFERKNEINQLKKLQSSSIPRLNFLNAKRSTRGPELADIVRACTAIQANDMINYERLEILGDSFLKFATSFFLFTRYTKAEGFLTTTKKNLISNRNLMYCALKKNLDKFINVYDFSPLSDWNPPNFCVPEELKNAIVSFNKDPVVLYQFNILEEEQFSGFITNEILIQNLNIIREAENVDLNMQTNALMQTYVINDKVLADVVEALIGAYVRDSGIEGGFIILDWFNLLPKNENSFNELFNKPYDFQYLEGGTEEEAIKMLEERLVFNLEDMLGYSFKNKGLLLEALTHPSYSLNRMTLSFQRLEFLGDAILDFLITVYIYENFEYYDPGKITDARSALVNNITFGCLSVKYDFHKYMFSLSPDLNNCIEAFTKFQISRNHAIRENVLLLQEEGNCLIAETVTLPKALSDIFESIAGAIFLDSGNSLKTVWNVYYKLMKSVIDEFLENIPKSSVRLFTEILSYKPIFNLTQVDNFIKAECTFEFKDYQITVNGFGKNKKAAKLSASKLGLKKILELKK